MEADTLKAVVAELNRRGIAASLEYPGAIVTRLKNGACLTGGDANETFMIDITDANNPDSVETVESTIASDSTDVQAIADFYAVTVTETAEVFSDWKPCPETGDYRRIDGNGNVWQAPMLADGSMCADPDSHCEIKA